ncbi:MAG: CDP-glycerol glycerophosphotransferase family protein [Candidatus Cohnella colombiensis]|uniref:CDP-glycerol glycerophosphotransferase family protein n=1 Tax=Candidatus Cohnella colombiensis TaxID=3121368 RepID=A0AA95JA21_9BACL|nr:MAG: CDP-glycerol glycerophosphotransferase family protein [Cohnella sp.]
MSKKLKVVLFHTSSSGSNTYFLYHQFPQELRDKYEVRLVSQEELMRDPSINNGNVFITTHGEYPSSPDKVNIELWHGFPLKGMNNMDVESNVSFEAVMKYTTHLNLVASYSGLYNTLYSACMGVNVNQYAITGMPRNDALFYPNSHEQLYKMFPDLRNKKTLFFMPTFRKSALKPDVEGNKNFSNPFGFDDFDLERFTAFLRQNDLSLVLKLHPFEERYFLRQLAEWRLAGIHLITDGLLKQNQLDLYEVLGAADLLITDYSSVYFDYLILDRPILFVPTDLEAYQSNRGMLLQPYEFWSPGAKALNQSELEHAILDAIQDPDAYSSQRKLIRDLTHKYTDNRASERLWSEIDQCIDRHLLEQKEKEENIMIASSIKSTISQKIEQGELKSAKETLQELVNIIKLDAEICSMKAIIELLEGNSKQAIDTLRDGDRKFPDHPDIIYNLAYCHESINDYPSAAHYYRLLLKITTNTELLTTVQERLEFINQQSNEVMS